MSIDKRNQTKSASSCLDATNYAKEHCRRGKENEVIDVWERQTKDKRKQNRLKIHFFSCSSYKGSVLSIQAIMMIRAH